jgi:hypothetical protein
MEYNMYMSVFLSIGKFILRAYTQILMKFGSVELGFLNRKLTNFILFWYVCVPLYPLI